jgi:hypothetical protein
MRISWECATDSVSGPWTEDRFAELLRPEAETSLLAFLAERLAILGLCQGR